MNYEQKKFQLNMKNKERDFFQKIYDILSLNSLGRLER